MNYIPKSHIRAFKPKALHKFVREMSTNHQLLLIFNEEQERISRKQCEQYQMCGECEFSGLHWNPTIQEGNWVCFKQSRDEGGYVYVEDVVHCPLKEGDI